MILFAIAAGVVAVIHLVGAFQRPRLAVIVSGVLWLLYAYYEHQVATGVLCDKDCNIRVDLVFFFPILGAAASCAYKAYEGRPGQMMVLGTVLAVIGLLAFALRLESSGYAGLSGLACAAALLVGLSPIIRRRVTSRSSGAR